MNPYACHNHPPYKSSMPMQDGWYQDGYTRTPKMRAVPHSMAKDCRYTHTDLGKADQRCDGCIHRATTC